MIRPPKNFYPNDSWLAIVRQQGVIEYAYFDSDARDIVELNGPYHIRAGVIYSIKGFTLQGLLAKFYGNGNVRNRIDCDYSRDTYSKHDFTLSFDINKAREIKLKDIKSLMYHPKTRYKTPDDTHILTSFLPDGKEIQFRCNVAHTHLMPLHVRFNRFRGICNRKGIPLTRILYRAKAVNPCGKFKLTDLYDYSISNFLFTKAAVYRRTWTSCTLEDGTEGYRCDVWFKDYRTMSVFTDGKSYDTVADTKYNSKLSGMSIDIMLANGIEVTNVVKPARYYKHYENAIERGDLSKRALWENKEGMKLMKPAKIYKYRRVHAEKIVKSTDGVEMIDYRASSMRINE